MTFALESRTKPRKPLVRWWLTWFVTSTTFTARTYRLFEIRAPVKNILYLGIVVYVVVAGLVDGCYVVLLPILTAQLMGVEKSVLAWGFMIGTCSLTFTLGPPAAGTEELRCLALTDVYGHSIIIYLLLLGVRFNIIIWMVTNFLM